VTGRLAGAEPGLEQREPTAARIQSRQASLESLGPLPQRAPVEHFTPRRRRPPRLPTV